MIERQGHPFTRGGDVPWEDAGEGVMRQVLSYDAGVMIVRVAFEAGAVGPPHTHPHLQCSLVESGVFDITIAGHTERLRAGDTFLVPSGVLHGAVAVEAGGLTDVFTPMRADFVGGSGDTG